MDDGSPDGCPEICDSYAAQDSRITVIHKENEGVVKARNMALELVKGKYLVLWTAMTGLTGICWKNTGI